MSSRIGRTGLLKSLAVAALLIAVLVTLPAQPVEPAWLLVARGEKLLSEGEYGRALQTFREALQLRTDYPEALFGIGRAYKSILDYDIAVRYLSEAISLSDRFEVTDRFYSASYELAEIHRVRRRFAEYESTLYSMVDRASWMPEAFGIDDMSRTFRDSGLDRMLVLYRLPQDGSQRAHSELAELLVGLGRNASAEHHALIAVSQQLTVVIGAIISRDPTYEFSSVQSAFLRAASYPESREYVASATLGHDLYFLGSALWAQGNHRAARATWSVAAELPESGMWAQRSKAQLDDPKPEPLLIVD